MANKELAKEILHNVGNEENIESLTHCVTRLRFKLINDSKTNKDVIEKLDGVIRVVKSGGQFQVVIGNNVGNVYEEIAKLTNIFTGNKENAKESNEKTSISSKILDLISGILAPVLNILASVSIFKALLSIGVYYNIIATNSEIYKILYVAGDSAFYFMPVFIAYTAAKKFGANKFIAITLGATLIHPAAFNFGGNNLSGIYFSAINYSYTFVPIIISILVLSKVEKTLNKIIHENLKIFLFPSICLIIMVPLSFVIIGPLATVITNAVGLGYNFLYNLSPIFLGILVGAFWQALVIKGIHWIAMPIIINNLSLYGTDTFMALAISASLGQAGAVLGVLLKTRNKDIKEAAMSVIPTGLLGITEPTIYGITLKYKIPFVCASIGGAIGGAIAGYSGSASMGYIIPGILTLPVYFGSGFSGLLVAVVTSYILSAILSFVAFKDSKIDNKIKVDDNARTEEGTYSDNKKELEKTVKTEIIKSPLNGKIIELSKVSDEVFASEAMGKGIAIIPSDGILVSPVDGIVSVLFPTRHAVGITSNSGAEILVHIGFDTVSLNGKYFKANVAQGEYVKTGDLLVEFDINKIESEGLDITTPIIVTNTEKYYNINLMKQGTVVASEDILSLE